MNIQDRSLGQRMAAEIRAEMARQDRSIRSLAEQIGESHVTVGRWVKGRTSMSLNALDSVCQALGLSVADLLAAVERNGGYDPFDTRKAAGRNSHHYVPVGAAA